MMPTNDIYRRASEMTEIDSVFAPIADAIISHVMAGVKRELKKMQIGPQYVVHDRSLTRDDVTKKLGISAKTLYERLKLGTVPPPFTHGDEYPRWSELTIEKYMRGEWKREK